MASPASASPILSADPVWVEAAHPKQLNEQVGLAIAVHITLQMPIGKPQFSRCVAEATGADVIPAWIGEGIRAVQHGGDPQPIALPAVEIGDRVLPAAGDIIGLIREEVCSLSTAEPV